MSQCSAAQVSLLTLFAPGSEALHHQYWWQRCWKQKIGDLFSFPSRLHELGLSSSHCCLSVAPQFHCFLCSRAQLSMVPCFETKKYRQLRLPPTEHQYRTLRSIGGGGRGRAENHAVLHDQAKISKSLRIVNCCNFVDIMIQIEEKTILLVLVWDGSVPEE